jgi:hypothetical protein
MALCTVCEVPLRAHVTDLLRHAVFGKHIANMEKYNTEKQRRLDAMGSLCLKILTDVTRPNI